VAARLTDYWHQRRRWAHDAPASALPPRSAPGAQRIVESWLTALGYTDRLAFLLATVLAACGRVSALVPGAYAGIRLAEVVAVLARSRPALREWLRHAVAAALLLPVDIAVSLAAHADRRRPVWRRPPRTP
jgi:hypothetical protein